MRMRIRYMWAIVSLSVLVLFPLLLKYQSSNSDFNPLRKRTISKSTRPIPRKQFVSALEYRPSLDLMPIALRTNLIKVTISAEEYRASETINTGNPLIADYERSDDSLSGESGRGLTFVGEEKDFVEKLTKKYQVNVYASDLIPLNRHVPDSRTKGCENVVYDHDLPTASIIIPFFDEWPSILLRTLYSVINRTPRHLLQEIILIDDASTIETLKQPLDEYVANYFPQGLIRIIHLKEREGLIKARLKGWRQAVGDVIVVFDSHMEVNINWLPPLLAEIKKDRNTVAMGILDYVNRENMEYFYHRGYLTRYGFNWQMGFFETFFRKDHIGPYEYSPRNATVMVGAAFAIDRKYFGEIGSYDENMKVWGGENLEMSWRVWLCGGRLLHIPCSHFGHIARSQPYEFPGGRKFVELFNYKRAVEVWLGSYKEFVYNNLPDMKSIDPGNLNERLELKKKLKCKNMTTYIHEVWPELSIYNENAQAWGSAKNIGRNLCLDNKSYLFQSPAPLYAFSCHYQYSTQGFTITNDGLFKTTLQCVVVKNGQPMLEDCIIGPRDKWKHHPNGIIQHLASGLCLEIIESTPAMTTCNKASRSQLWTFNHYSK